MLYKRVSSNLHNTQDESTYVIVCKIFKFNDINRSVLGKFKS
jgi:hypothetical protein